MARGDRSVMPVAFYQLTLIAVRLLAPICVAVRRPTTSSNLKVGLAALLWVKRNI